MYQTLLTTHTLKRASYLAVLCAVLFVLQNSWLHNDMHLASTDQHCSVCQSLQQLSHAVIAQVNLPQLIPAVSLAHTFIPQTLSHVVSDSIRNRGPPL